MLNLHKLPIYDPDPAKSQQRLVDMLVADGRAYRRAGFPITNCPPFRDEDMAISWKMGWRWQDEDMARK